MAVSGFGFPTHAETFYTGTPSQSISKSASGSTSTARSSSGTYYTPWQTQAMQGLYPQLLGQIFGQPSYRVGMSGARDVTLPGFTVGGIWSPQRIQEQVNLMRSIAEQQAAGQLRRQTTDLLGRGYGAGSPLLAALGQTSAMQNYAGQTQAENELRTRMDQMNKQHLMATQQARAQTAAEQARINQQNRNLDIALYGQMLQAKNPAPYLGLVGQMFQPLSRSSSQQASRAYSTSTSASRGSSGSGGFMGY